MAYKLDDSQESVASHENGALLVLAVAGSGKTTAITHRAARMLSMGVSGLTMLTYTSKSAKEMQERVAQVAKCRLRDIAASTFHSFALNILRQEPSISRYRKGMKILPEYRALSMIKRIREHSTPDLEMNAETILGWLDRVKDSGYSHQGRPAEWLVQAGFDNDTALDLNDVMIRFEKEKEADKTIQFGDMLHLLYQGLIDNPEILHKWQQRIRHLMVDEYQDTSPIQYGLVKLFGQTAESCVVVGDDDQSIYSFRGAVGMDNVTEFTQDFEPVKVTMDNNYRCAANIVKAANNLVVNNKQRVAKTLKANLPDGPPIVCETHLDVMEQASAICRAAQQQRDDGSAWRNIAILVRQNIQTVEIEVQLAAKNIPYSMKQSHSFFGRPEIRVAMALIELVSGHDTSLENALEVADKPIKYLSSKENYAELKSYMHGKAENNALHALSMASWRSSEPVKLWATWALGMKNKTLSELLDGWVYGPGNMVVHIEKTSPDLRDDKLDSIAKLVSLTDGNASIEKARRDLVRVRDEMARCSDNKDGADAVQILTMHSSKGLEFGCVHIPDMIEEVVPHKKGVQEGGIEEERRLMYVAITRAKAQLSLYRPKQTEKRKQLVKTVESRFIGEMQNVGRLEYAALGQG